MDIWKYGLCLHKLVKRGFEELGWSLNPVTCPCKKAMWRHRDSGKIHVTVEAEVAVMQLQARECQRKPATIRGEEETRKDSERARLCSHLDFGLQASRSWGEYISAVLSQPLSGNLLLGS